MHRKKMYRVSLLDHLVGAGEQRRRNVDAKRLRGLEIDHQLELGRLLDRQIGGLFADLPARLWQLSVRMVVTPRRENAHV